MGVLAGGPKVYRNYRFGECELCDFCDGDVPEVQRIGHPDVHPGTSVGNLGEHLTSIPILGHLGELISRGRTRLPGTATPGVRPDCQVHPGNLRTPVLSIRTHRKHGGDLGW